MERINGDKEWWKDGQCHRLNGPAVEKSNGEKCWYIEGKKYTEEEWKKLSFAILNNLEIFFLNDIYVINK